MKHLLLLLLLPFGISASHRSTKANPKQWPPSASLRFSGSHHTHMPTKAKPEEKKQESKQEEKKQTTNETMTPYSSGQVTEEPMVRIGCMDVPLRTITMQALEKENK